MSHITWTHSPDDTAETWSLESLYGFESWAAEDDYNWDLQTENWDVWGDIAITTWTHVVGSVAEDWILLDYWVDNSELWNEEDLVWHH